MRRSTTDNMPEWNRQQMSMVIETYRTYPALWDAKSEQYKKRNLKATCYQKMCEELLHEIPDLNVAVLKNTIHEKSIFPRT